MKQNGLSNETAQSAAIRRTPETNAIIFSTVQSFFPRMFLKIICGTLPQLLLILSPLFRSSTALFLLCRNLFFIVIIKPNVLEHSEWLRKEVKSKKPAATLGRATVAVENFVRHAANLVAVIPSQFRPGLDKTASYKHNSLINRARTFPQKILPK